MLCASAVQMGCDHHPFIHAFCKIVACPPSIQRVPPNNHVIGMHVLVCIGACGLTSPCYAADHCIEHKIQYAVWHVELSKIP